MQSNEASWLGMDVEPEVTSEQADPDDTTISSSNLGPRDPYSYDPTSRSGPDAAEDELDDDEMPSVRPGNPWASFF